MKLIENFVNRCSELTVLRIVFLFSVYLLFLFTICSCSGVYTSSTYDISKIKEEFTSIFKNTKVVEVKESEIPGVYEIYCEGTLNNIIYYYPEKKILILGEFWSINGTSITGEKSMIFFEKLSKELFNEKE